MSKITLAIEHPSLGYGEIIASYDLSEIQEKAYKQGRADVIGDCKKILLNPCDCERDCVIEDRTDCVNCMAKRMDQLKEKTQ